MTLNLAKEIYDVTHLTGTFTLRSGQTSDEYFDKYLFESDPAILAQVAEELVGLIPEDTEVLAGLEMGGDSDCNCAILEVRHSVRICKKKSKGIRYLQIGGRCGH